MKKIKEDSSDFSRHENDNCGEDYSTGESKQIRLAASREKFREPLEENKKKCSRYCLAFVAFSSGIAFFLVDFHTLKFNNAPVENITPVQQPVKCKFASLQDFIINFKDGGGKEKIFVCALALEISPDHKLAFKDDHFDIRKMIYKKLLTCSRENTSFLQDRNRLRDFLFVELNQQLGGNIVTGIYFTKFMIL
jgi:flagellar basal body-associated protein FliL